MEVGGSRVSPRRHRFPPASRVRKGGEIRRVLRRGRRNRTPLLDIFQAPSPFTWPRYGIIVPRHGHRIVDRNLLRRRLREIGRVEILPRLREAGVHRDILVRARVRAYRATFEELRLQLVEFTEALCSNGSSSS